MRDRCALADQFNPIDGSFITNSPEETLSHALKLSSHLHPGSVICLKGDLGSGKTSFVKGLTSGAALVDPKDVVSPTFNYLNIYQGPIPVFHFDLYRLKNVEDFLSMGFEEYFDAGGICCIEWFERIASILPKNAVIIDFKVLSYEKREIRIFNLS